MARHSVACCSAWRTGSSQHSNRAWLVMARVVMASRTGSLQHSNRAWLVMAYIVMAYIVMVYIVMAYIVMADRSPAESHRLVAAVRHPSCYKKTTRLLQSKKNDEAFTIKTKWAAYDGVIADGPNRYGLYPCVSKYWGGPWRSCNSDGAGHGDLVIVMGPAMAIL